MGNFTYVATKASIKKLMCLFMVEEYKKNKRDIRFLAFGTVSVDVTARPSMSIQIEPTTVKRYKRDLLKSY